MGLIFGILSNNCIWWYINLAKFKVLLYNLKCSLRDWQDFNLASSEKFPNCQMLLLAKSTHTVYNGPTLLAQLLHAGSIPFIHVGLTVDTSLHSSAYFQSMQIECYQN